MMREIKGPLLLAPLTILQHEAAEDESEDHAKRNGDDAPGSGRRG